jgi:hypothetical protein
VREGRCGLRRPVTGFRVTRIGSDQPMAEADIANSVQLLDLMLEFFADDLRWTRGCYE